MSDSKIRWEPYGSMHFGYLGERDSHGFSYIIQGPDKGMYALYAPPDYTSRMEFEDLEIAKLTAEKMEESKC
jgi:hypothetical protein